MPRHLKPVAGYLFLVVAVFICVGVALIWGRSASQSGGNLIQKLAYYKAHGDQFDTVFLGDSRTYCGLHPEQLDPLLGAHSYNLAHWSNWFPTQYAFLQDFLPHLRPGTTVVWSLGHVNFVDAAIQPAYPVGWHRLARYGDLGFGVGDLWANLMEWTPGTNVVTPRPILGPVDKGR